MHGDSPAVESVSSQTDAYRAQYYWTSYSVLPILFVPTDWSVSSATVAADTTAISNAMAEVQSYYQAKLGRSFRRHALQVVQANNRKESYGITWNGRNIYVDGITVANNFEGAVVAELYARGYPTPPSQNESGYKVVIFVKGAGGWAGGREFGTDDGGWAILGDWCIDSLVGRVAENAYWWSGARKQKGSIAHELGHTFGLPHPDAYGQGFDTTIMGNWWDYPTIGFNDHDKAMLVDREAPYMCNKLGFVVASTQYVCAEGGGGREVVANRWALGPWETFTFHPVAYGPRFGLRANAGQWVCAEGGGGREVVANRSALGPWEEFEFVARGGANRAIRVSNGQYMCAEGGGGRQVVANRSAIGAWEIFKVVCGD